jgi:hypothetical protein
MVLDGNMTECASYCDMCEGKTVSIAPDGSNLIFITNITPTSVTWYFNNVFYSNESMITPDIFSYGIYKVVLMDSFCTISSEYEYIDDP